MKIKNYAFILILIFVLFPVGAAGPEVTDPALDVSYTKREGDVTEIPSTKIDFNLSLSGLGVFDAGFSSTKVDKGTPPSRIQLVNIDQNKAKAEDCYKSKPVYMYLRFFGNKANTPSAIVKVNGPLTGGTYGNSLDWQVKVTYVGNSADTFILKSNGISEKTITPVLDPNSGATLVNVVDCYELVFETTEAYWKVSPESYSGELWLNIITTN